MNTTSATLLEKLRLPGQDSAWGRFVELYKSLNGAVTDPSLAGYTAYK